MTKEQVENWLKDALRHLEDNPSDAALGVVSLREVFVASNIHGANTAEYAEYLGYLDGKKLYPDFDFLSYKEYVRGVLGGKFTARSAPEVYNT